MARCGHVARQLHLPVQSGCDRVLRAMNRPYDKAKYLDLITYARKVMPDLVLTSDVIIGFPGETEAEAMETVALVREVEFDALFTFIFSPRPGTPAAKMLNRVDADEAQRRADLVVDVQSRIMDDFNESRMGDVTEVLCDGWDEQSQSFVGRSYAESPDIDGRIYFGAERDVQPGEFVPVRITGAMDGELTGELAEEE